MAERPVATAIVATRRADGITRGWSSDATWEGLRVRTPILRPLKNAVMTKAS